MKTKIFIEIQARFIKWFKKKTTFINAKHYYIEYYILVVITNRYAVTSE